MVFQHCGYGSRCADFAHTVFTIELVVFVIDYSSCGKSISVDRRGCAWNCWFGNQRFVTECGNELFRVFFMKKNIHPLAEVQSQDIGADTRVWQFCVVLAGAKIGSDCNICSHCLIENDVIIGDRVTVKSGVQLWDGLRVADDVFIGPNVTFANDKYPRSKNYPASFPVTTIGTGASIGGGAVILPGLTIGEYAMIGAGAVVTRDVPPRAIVVGNPARVVGYGQASHEPASQAKNLKGEEFDGKDARAS